MDDRHWQRADEIAGTLIFWGLVIIIGVAWFFLDYVSGGNIASLLD